MKKQLISLAACSLLLFAASCKDKDNNNDNNNNNDDVVQLTGEITTQTLSKDKKYLLVGQVFVRDGQTLTIEPGTIIMGEKKSKGTLVIDRGGKLMAEGTATEPIVFTSNQAAGDRDRGDWGGVVVLGKAKVNIPDPSIEGIEPAVTFGGSDDADNSGVIKYVRVEFAGIELTPNNETNSITMGAVGNGTTFENIQVSYGGDDGIEWFGGTVNGKYLVEFASWDDSYDIDNGFSGNLQFGLALRYPSYADQSDSNGFEWDTNGTNDETNQPTTVTVSNFTVLGPCIDGNSYNKNFKYAMDLRRRVAANIFNSVFLGFPTGARMNQSSVYPNYENGSALIANNVIYAKSSKTASGNDTYDADAVLTYLTNNDNTVEAGSEYEASAAYTALGIKPNLFFGETINNAYPAHPDFTLSGGTLATGANFGYAAFSESNRTNHFDKSVSFIGAFGSTDWTQGWTNFDPINAEY